MIHQNISDENQLKLVLLHYKKFYISLGIIVLCVILFFTFIIPQIQQYSEARVQIQEVQDRILILEKNISFLSNVNEQEQNAQTATVLAALPEDKDYAGILFAVKSASSKAGVGIGDFTFQVGELSAKSVITKNLPTISMQVNVVGDPVAIEKFLLAIAETLPLSNITEVTMGSRSTEVVLEFYYKPIATLRMNYAQPFVQMSPQNKNLLDQLTKWQTAQPILYFDSSPLESSSSAGGVFGF